MRRSWIVFFRNNLQPEDYGSVIVEAESSYIAEVYFAQRKDFKTGRYVTGVRANVH